jgi:antitoxin ChpS
MPSTHLRKVGGSVMMAVPSAILEQLQLQAGATVNLAIEGGRLIVEPKRKPRYSLEELLAQCEADAPVSAEDREWLDAHPVGREIL